MLQWLYKLDHLYGLLLTFGLALIIEGVARNYFYYPGDGFGFGLGLAVRTDPGNAKPPPPGSLGELKWDGASGCYFVIDRKQDLFFVLLEQTPSERQKIQPAVKKLIYEALEN